jgi:SsrA-binding protein
MSKHKQTPENIIASNRKALHDYTIESRFEAGMVLEGWEVKSLRGGRAQLRDSYVVFRNQEAWLIGLHISTLATTAQQSKADPQRSRKLLLKERELNELFGAVQRQGYTLVPLNLHWRHNRVKAEIGLVKGKKQYDKRETEKQREWQREKSRVLKQGMQ